VALVDVAVPVITFVVLTAVGMDLTPAQFREVRREPRCLVVGLLAPVVLLPLLALGLIALFRPEPAVAAGLLLVAACPIGGISNTYSYLAGASTALSVSLTTVSSAMAVGTIPAISWALEWARGQPMGFVAPAILPIQLLLMLLLPVATGMWVRQRWPQVALRARSAMQRVAFGAMAALLVIVVMSDLNGFLRDLPDTAPLSIAFIVGSFGVGWLVASLVRASRPDRFTLATEFATRNVAIATAIAVTLLGQPAFAIFAATYFLIEVPIMLGAVGWFRHRVMPGDAARAPAPAR
jgi:bile acid:Na+ symporter, BASS family